MEGDRVSCQTPRVLDIPARSGRPAAQLGYLRPGDFGAMAAREVEAALSSFALKKVNGIILDLRDSPGGLYREAVRIADAFIKSGPLVSMVGVNATQRKDETATEAGTEPLVPVAVPGSPMSLA
jgi:C-terminal processing protease CtpA/Prc